MLSKIAKAALQPIKQAARGQKVIYQFSAPHPEGRHNSRQENMQDQEYNNKQHMEDEFEMKSGGRTAQAEEESETIQNKQEKVDYIWQAWRVFVWGNIALLGYNYYLLKSSEKPEEELGSFDIFQGGAQYIDNKIQNSINFFTKPPTNKLLPDIPFMAPGAELPKTLVINLSGTILHTNYVFGKGAEIVKRPGLQKLIRAIQQQFEVVILTDDETGFTMEVAQKLDPAGVFISGFFGRESMVYEGGRYIKDLKYLNRDLNKIIVIDHKPERLKHHTDNGIFLSEFDGDSSDQELLKLIPFLNHLSRPEIKDVRREISYYGNHNPQEKFQEELKQRQQELEKRQKTGLSGFLGQASQPNYARKFNSQQPM